jgi:hypothetical protein
LHGVLADTGVYAATVAINVFIGTEAPPGVLNVAPDDIAAEYWRLHKHRDVAAPGERLRFGAQIEIAVVGVGRAEASVG